MYLTSLQSILGDGLSADVFYEYISIDSSFLVLSKNPRAVPFIPLPVCSAIAEEQFGLIFPADISKIGNIRPVTRATTVNSLTFWIIRAIAVHSISIQ